MRPTKSAHSFEVGGKQVKFSSYFDSGNLRTVTQVGVHSFLIESALDSYEMPVSQKSFFHFRVEDYPEETQLILTIQNISLLSCIKPEKLHRYRPCYSLNGIDYERLSSQEIEILENRTTLRIKFIIKKPIVYFAFSIPYSYERYLNMIRDLPESNEQFYIKKEVLCYSKNLHLVYMVTITSYDRQTKDSDQIGSSTNGVILPEKHLHQERVFFDKPVILLSARVHPGESPSSWAIEGIIKFLIGNSPQAVLLRKNFLIVIVPMLNPDGVYEGMYRLDTLGHNLNRYYLISDNRQPSIYSMKHLIKHYHASKRLLFYFDFHGHPSFKGSFLYGNAIDDIAYQAEIELFGTLMSLKCQTFEEKYCIFDRQQMNSKDRFDMYTKQGCARVYAYRTTNIIHAFTVQMGFHSCTAFNNAQNYPETKPTDTFQYSAETYYEEGIAVLKSVLEVSGLLHTSNLDKLMLRHKLAGQILIREQRFRKQEKNIYMKRKNVNQIIQNVYWKPIRFKFFNMNTIAEKRLYKSNKDSTKKVMNRTTYLPQPENQEAYQQDKKEETIQMTETMEEKSIELLMMQTRKKKLQAKQVVFNMKNRRFSITATTNKSKSTKIKSVLDHILPKSTEKSFQHTKRKQIKILNEKKGQSDPTFAVRMDQLNEETMFGDMGMREDLPSRVKNKVKQNKNTFSFISASNFTSKGQEIHEIFKNDETIQQEQFSHRKAIRTHKKYFKFFQT